MGESPPHGHPSFHCNHVLWVSLLLLFMVIQVFSAMIAVLVEIRQGLEPNVNMGEGGTWIPDIRTSLLMWYAPQSDTLRVTSL